MPGFRDQETERELRRIEHLMNGLLEDVAQIRAQLQLTAPEDDIRRPDGVLPRLTPMISNLEQLRAEVRTHEQERAQLKALQRVTELINSTLQLDDVLHTVMDVIINLTGAERSLLMLISYQTGELTVRAARDQQGEATPDEIFDIDRSIIDLVVHAAESVLTVRGEWSILCVPLITKGEVKGAIYADNRVDAHTFDESERGMLLSFANQAALAIENARLFAKVRANEQRLQQRVRELIIEIDSAKKEREVAEIMSSDYFQSLEQKADQIRKSVRSPRS